MRVDELHVCIATGGKDIVTADKVAVCIEVPREVCEGKCTSAAWTTTSLQKWIATVGLESTVKRCRLRDLRSRIIIHVARVGVSF